MELTVGQGFALDAVLNKVVNLGDNLPFKASYRIMRLAQKLESELKVATRKRGELYRDLGDPVPDQPGQRQITPENMPAFQTAFTELVGEKIEMPDWKVTLPDEITGLSPIDVFTLMPFLDIGDDELTDADDDAETVKAGVPAPGA